MKIVERFSVGEMKNIQPSVLFQYFTKYTKRPDLIAYVREHRKAEYHVKIFIVKYRTSAVPPK